MGGDHIRATTNSHGNNVIPNKPLIGVSRCLLGDRVRYDGDSKPHHVVIEQLAAIFELVPVCPEVEAGLGVPRPPVQLTANIAQPRVSGRDDASIDVTEALQLYCERRIPELDKLAGFIVKSRSPSCGLNSTPVFIDGHCATQASRGVFVRELCKRYPGMPVIEETQLENPITLEHFIHTINKQVIE
jgi:uncharacterized protein YbbK (DUF523 family)